MTIPSDQVQSWSKYDHLADHGCGVVAVAGAILRSCYKVLGLNRPRFISDNVIERSCANEARLIDIDAILDQPQQSQPSHFSADQVSFTLRTRI
jgi:hypothetical protein